MKKIFKFTSIAALFFLSLGSKAQFCPSINTTAAPTAPLCQGNCAVLNASVVPVNATNTYSIQSIPYTPFAYTGGTGVSVGTDDVWSPVINLGFNFCYFGNTYSTCILGSNGQLSFNTALAGGYDNWSISTAIPSLADMPGNTICAAFRDIDPSFGGNMRYYFSGSSPCRALVIYWDNIPLYANPGACSGKPNSTFQLVLYENTNYIDVYIANSTSCSGWNSGRGIVGIQNSNGTVAYSPPSRNSPTAWTAVNEGWRFVPTGVPSYTVTWAGPSGIIGTGLTQSVCPTTTTTYSATLNVTSCTGVNSTYTSAVTVTVSPSPPPVLTPTINQLSCSTFTNSGAVLITSGTPGYTVNWSPAATPSGSTGTTYSVTGMTPGLNTVTVTDASGCGSSITLSVTAAPPASSFSISAPSGTLIGCNPSSVQLCAVNTNTNLSNMTYTWTSTSTGTATGSCINASVPSGTNNIYTIFGSDLTAGSCVATQTFVVAQNAAIPSVTVTPPTQSVTCNSTAKCFTATCVSSTTNSLNLVGQWFGPGPVPIGAVSNSPLIMCTNSPGVYTVAFTDITNGCVGTNTVSVTANTMVPTMTVNALSGYTLTCSQTCLVFNIQASAGPAPKVYSWTNMQTSTTVTNTAGGYTVCNPGAGPGNYLAEYQDGFGCKVSQQISITIDTVKLIPNAITNMASNGFTVNCYHPVLTATAISTPMMPANNYSWTVPPNLTITKDTISISTVSVTANPTTFTVLVTGPNGCVGKKKVLFYEDLVIPTYAIVYTPTAITCANPQVALSPNLTSGPTGPTNFTFTSPAPTTTANASGALFGLVGTYTMNYQYLQNGCIGTATNNVTSNMAPPATIAVTPTVIPCGALTTTLTAGTTTTSGSYTYVWQPPVGAGMSCSSCYSTTANTPGVYYVTITNTVNGCIATNTVQVTTGNLSVGMTAEPATGFAPLSVNFNNTTALGSAAAGTITTTWTYGNGISNTYTNTSVSGSPSGSTVYQAPGSYTVLLIVQQQSSNGGSCVGSATTVVTVDQVSNMSVPNVFTPNGDNVNDVFVIQSTNLSNVTCVIFDRWGVKMYDVNSETGQIGWDGKNLGGKEVPAGIYFYLLKATGKDGSSFEKQGTVSLYR